MRQVLIYEKIYKCIHFRNTDHSLKIGMLTENGDSTLKLLQRVSHSQINSCVRVRSKLPNFLLKRLSTSSIILKFSEYRTHSILPQKKMSLRHCHPICPPFFGRIWRNRTGRPLQGQQTLAYFNISLIYLFSYSRMQQ